MERDLESSVLGVNALDNADITTNTTTVGNIIDTVGFESLTYFIQAGTLVDGDYNVLLEDGEDSNLSDAAPVGLDFLIGSLPVFADTEDGAVKEVGVVSKKRFQRLSIVSTNVTTGGPLTSIAVKGHADSRPT